MFKLHFSRFIIALAPLVLFVAAVGCGESSDPAGGPPQDVSADPRCNALCSDMPPIRQDFFAVCSADSLFECADLCETRISDVSGLCAECLLEDAAFDSPGEDLWAHEVCLEDGTCYLGLSQWCSGGCWVVVDSADCSGLDCEGESVRARYDEDVQQGGACAFDEQDAEARDRCYAEQYPRTEQACSVEFASVSNCAEICSTP